LEPLWNKALWIHSGWGACPNSEIAVQLHTISKKVKEYVLNEHFWEQCTNFHEVVAPVMWALRDFDGKSPCMEKILHIFRNLEKHIVSLRGEPFRLDHDMADPMEDAFYNHWTMDKQTYIMRVHF
jgi:hypothetical protein